MQKARGTTQEVTPMLSLIERAKNGDAEAFGELYKQYAVMIFNFISARIDRKDLAEDLTTDTFVRALKSIGTFKWRGTDIGAWFTTIARNLVIDHYKSGYNRLVTVADTCADTQRVDPKQNVEKAAIDSLANQHLLHAIRQLSPDQQQCVMLYYFGGLKNAQIAEMLQKDPGAIKAVMYRARRQLRRLMPEGFKS